MQKTIQKLKNTPYSLLLALSIFLMVLNILSSFGLIAHPNLILVVSLLTIVVFFIKVFFKTKELLLKYNTSIYYEVVTIFTLLAAIPATIVTIFSIILFQYGINSWFDNQVTNILTNSSNITKAYIDNTKGSLSISIRNVSQSLEGMYYELMHDGILFEKVLNHQSKIHQLSDIILFHKDSNRILSKSGLSFIQNIPSDILIDSSEEILEIFLDSSKIAVITNLYPKHGIYLIIAKNLDSRILENINENLTLIEKYKILESKIKSLHINFMLIFILLTTSLIIGSLFIGKNFSNKVVKPIKLLANAFSKIRAGTLDTIKIDVKNKNEIVFLAEVFNKMVLELKQNRKDLESALRAAAWSDVAKRVAHEIKNPLTPLSLSAEMLEKKFLQEVSDPERFKKYTSTILKHTEDIKKIIGDFINFARLQKPKFQTIDLAAIIKDLIDSRQALYEKNTYTYNGPENFIINADLTQIRQVIINILKNSEEAKQEKLEFSAQLEILDNFYIITFKDNGKGFPKNILNGENIVSNKGMGLGISIVKKIVSDHNGTLQMYNNDGAVIVIKIPR